MNTKYAVILNDDQNCMDLIPLIQKIDFDDIIFIDNLASITYLPNNYYTIIISANLISLSIKKDIIQMMKKNINISILTHRDFNSLRKFIIRLSNVKKYNYKNRSLILNRLEHDISSEVKNSEIVYLTYDNATLDNVSEIFSKTNTLVFSTISHGRDDIAWLTDGAICGRALEPSVVCSTKVFPACYYSDKCFKESLQLINASQINASNIFINSCYSLRFDNATYGNNYNICYSFMDGIAVSYIGSPFQIHGTIIMNLYYDALIKCGYSISEIVNALNGAYIQNKFGDSAPYFAIGLAHYKNKKSSKIYNVKVKDIIDNSMNVFEIQDKDIALIVLEMENTLYNYDDFLSGNLRINIFSDKKNDIYGIPLKNRILIFTVGNFPISKLYYKMEYKKCLPLSSSSNLFQIVSYLNLNKKNVQRVKSLFDYTSKLYRNSIFQSHLFSQISKNIYNKLDFIEKEYFALSNEFLNNLLNITKNKGFTLDEEFMECGFLESKRIKSKKQCDNCGVTLENVIYEHELYNSLSRSYEMCDNCGIIFDYPTLFNKDINIKLMGDLYMKSSREYDYILRIENKGKEDLFFSFGAAAVYSKDNNIEVQIEKLDNSIFSNKSIDVSFKIIIPKLIPPHEYWLRIYIVLNGQLFSIKRRVFIIK